MAPQYAFLGSILTLLFGWHAWRVVTHPRVRASITDEPAQLASILLMLGGLVLFVTGLLLGELPRVLALVGIGLSTSGVIILTDQVARSR
jgi:drug/metabolite transporter (DMT)-like permease